MKLLKEYERMNYKLENELDSQDDEDLCGAFCCDYDSGYISDIITEIADSEISVYSDDVLKEAVNLQDAYSRAKNGGLMEGSTELVQSVQIAWYFYNEQVLYENIKEMIYNYAINYIVEEKKYIAEEELKELEDNLQCLDNSSKLEEIQCIVNNIIENRRGGTEK